MGGARLLLGRDLRDLSSGAAFRIMVAVFIVMALAMAVGAAGLAAGIATAPDASTRAGLSMPYGQLLYFGSVLPLLGFIWLFAGATLSREKASGHLETLLATPLEPRDILLAKTEAMVLPGLSMTGLALLLELAAAGIASASVAGPAHDAFALVFPPALLATCVVANPVLFAGLAALTVILALRASPDAAILPSFALGFGLMIAVPGGAAIGIVDLRSWGFAGLSFGLAAIEWAIVAGLARGLGKERIVLSSREDK
jgi:ABC-type transport system involved in multi-copper enzyme maturation permease subunit